MPDNRVSVRQYSFTNAVSISAKGVSGGIVGIIGPHTTPPPTELDGIRLQATFNATTRLIE